MNAVFPISFQKPEAPHGPMVCAIDIRSNYGTLVAYPMNAAACAFARMTGKRTLTRYVLDEIQALGFEIVSSANSDWQQVR